MRGARLERVEDFFFLRPWDLLKRRTRKTRNAHGSERSGLLTYDAEGCLLSCKRMVKIPVAGGAGSPAQWWKSPSSTVVYFRQTARVVVVGRWGGIPRRSKRPAQPANPPTPSKTFAEFRADFPELLTPSPGGPFAGGWIGFGI